MLSLIEILEIEGLSFLQVVADQKRILVKEGEAQYSNESEVLFGGESLGIVSSNLEGEAHKELGQQIAALLYLHHCGYDWGKIINLQKWVKGAKDLVSEVTDWIGIYYKANYYLEQDSTDLVLGPYYGESTTHTRIPLERGLCGLALREERVVNVADVHQDTRHIACSLKTNSELIIPLKDSAGNMVAELDIDCNRLGAFSAEVEEKFKTYCQSFAKNWDKK